MKRLVVVLVLSAIVSGIISYPIYGAPEDAVYEELTQKVVEISKAWAAVPPEAGEEVLKGALVQAGYHYEGTFLVASFKNGNSMFSSLSVTGLPGELFERDIPKYIDSGYIQDAIGGHTVLYNFTKAADHERVAIWNAHGAVFMLTLNSPLAENPKPRNPVKEQLQEKEQEQTEADQAPVEEIQASIKIVPNLIALRVGDKGKSLNVKITPPDAPVGPVMLTGYDAEILAVDENATVTGKKAALDKIALEAEAVEAGLKARAWVYVIPQGAYGILIHTNDNTYILRGGEHIKEKVQNNTFLFQADRVYTYHPAGTMMISPEYGRMRIFPASTEVMLGGAMTVFYENMVNHAKATLTTIMKKLMEEEGFKIKIPTATCGVRG